MTDQEKRVLARIHDFKNVFGTPEGKRVLRTLMKNTGFLTTNYVQEDSHGTAYNEGARSVVIYILNQLKTDVKALEKQLSQERDGYE